MTDPLLVLLELVALEFETERARGVSGGSDGGQWRC